jgi:uncharacterized protein
MAALFGTAALWGSVRADHIWINEFHYDNAGADANEFIEVAVRSGEPFSAADFSVALYNGANGAQYDIDSLSTFATGATVPILNSLETVTFYSFTYPANGIQNGAPDGIALVNTATNSVVEFLSYEGTFTAAVGVADGAMSVDVGVSESGSDLVSSLSLTGLGSRAADFDWENVAVPTPGALNAGQVLVPEPASIVIMLFAVTIGLVAPRHG